MQPSLKIHLNVFRSQIFLGGGGVLVRCEGQRSDDVVRVQIVKPSEDIVFCIVHPGHRLALTTKQKKKENCTPSEFKSSLSPKIPA